MKKAFTLIELLIVVAIIAILAAIAVPNFLEAQTRSKVSRAKSDMRAFSVGVTAFDVDNNRYPVHNRNLASGGKDDGPFTTYHYWTEFLNELTTPIAYMTSVSQPDSFKPDGKTVAFPGVNSSNMLPPGATASYQWFDFSDRNVNTFTNAVQASMQIAPTRAFMITSWGPDRTYSSIEWSYLDQSVTPMVFKSALQWGGGVYDPTNGTISLGDIARFGGTFPLTSTP